MTPRDEGMPFAPHEIESKRFVVALRGYSTDEVESFLRAVAADYRALLDERETATRDAEELLRAAESEAERIRADALAAVEASFTELERRAQEVRLAEDRLRERLEAVEQAVQDGRLTLAR